MKRKMMPEFSQWEQRITKWKSRTGLLALALVVLLCGQAYAAPQWRGVGNGTSTDAPAITTYQNIPILAAHANDSSGAIWYSINEGNWKKVPGAITNAAPALITLEGEVFLVHTGTDGNFYTMPLTHPDPFPADWSFDQNWTQVPGARGQLNPNLRPALTASGDLLFIFGVYRDQSMHYASAPLINLHGSPILTFNNSWSEIPGSGFTDAGLSAVAAKGLITVTHTGTDRNPYVNTFNINGRFWYNGSWTRLPGFGNNFSLAPAASLTDKNDEVQEICGIDPNVLRITCVGITVAASSQGATYTTALQPVTLDFSIGNQPVLVRHSVSIARVDSDDSIYITATATDPTTGQPDVWIAGPQPTSEMFTRGN